MELIEAIYKRRSIRDYTDRPVAKFEIDALLQAAIHAPSAMNSQPWAFVIIQNAERLKNYSDRAKALLLKSVGENSPIHALHHGPTDPDFNIFYNAGTLIVICAKSGNDFAPGDCCLAGENLMLAACAAGLGTCPIGFALPWLRLSETKQELGIPQEYNPVLPIIVGYPSGATPATPRREPEIVSWR